MTDEVIVETARKYAKMMSELEYPVGDDSRILWKHNGKCYELAQGKVKDVTNYWYNEKEVLLQDEKMEAMVIFRTPFCQKCLERRESIPAVLDDMAQIIGQEVVVVPDDKKAIAKALKKAEAVLIEEKYGVACGRNIYEAYVAMTVLEKSAEVWEKSKVLGGAKKLSGFDAKLMRTVYVMKYSKAERKHKDECEG